MYIYHAYKTFLFSITMNRRMLVNIAGKNKRCSFICRVKKCCYTLCLGKLQIELICKFHSKKIHVSQFKDGQKVNLLILILCLYVTFTQTQLYLHRFYLEACYANPKDSSHEM